MANISPVGAPDRSKWEEYTRQAWHGAVRPNFPDLVALGYIEGADLLSFGSTISGYANSDGEVAFREGPKLEYGAALSGDTVYLVSSSASDTGTFDVQGLDANGDFQVQEVTATGTTPAAVPGTWNHVQRVVSKSADNAGTVYVSTDSGAIPTTVGDQIQCVMAVGDNYAINPELVVANDTIILINQFDFSVDVQQNSTVKILANRQGRYILNFKFFSADHYEQPFTVPLRLYPGDAIRVTVEAKGGTSSNATFGMNGVVLTNNNEPTKLSISEIF